jgi:hypothetical protein
MLTKYYYDVLTEDEMDEIVAEINTYLVRKPQGKTIVKT